MQHKKYFLLGLLIFALTRPILAQPGAGYQKDYKFLHSGNLVADKNFYLITVLDQTPVVRSLLVKDQHLLAIGEQRSAMLKQHVTDSCSWPGSLLDSGTFAGAAPLPVGERPAPDPPNCCLRRSPRETAGLPG